MEYAKYKPLKEVGNVSIVRKDGAMLFERDTFDKDTGEKKTVFEGCPDIEYHKSQLEIYKASMQGLEAIIADQQAILDAEEAAEKASKSE